MKKFKLYVEKKEKAENYFDNKNEMMKGEI